MFKVVAVELSSGHRCGDRSIEEGTHVHSPSLVVNYGNSVPVEITGISGIPVFR